MPDPILGPFGLAVDPNATQAVLKALDPNQSDEALKRKQKQAEAGAMVKSQYPELSHLEDREAVRQYIESQKWDDATKASAAAEAGLEHGGAFDALYRGAKDAFNPSWEAEPTPVGEGPGTWGPTAHMVGNIGGTVAQFASLPRLALGGANMIGRAIPAVARYARPAAAAVDLALRGYLGAAAGHRGIAQTAEETGRPVDPTADAIGTTTSAVLNGLPLGWGMNKGLAVAGNVIPATAGGAALGYANARQAGKDNPLPDMMLGGGMGLGLGSIGGYLGAKRPEPFHFSRASLPETVLPGAPQATYGTKGNPLTAEDAKINFSTKAEMDAAGPGASGHMFPDEILAALAAEEAARQAPGATSVPSTPHPAAVPSAAARPISGSTSVMGGVPGPAPAPASRPEFSLDPYAYSPNPALEGAIPGPWLEKGQADALEQQLTAQQQLREMMRMVPGSKAYLAGGKLTSELPETMGGGVGDVIAHMGDTDVQLGPNGPVVNKRLLYQQHEQKLTMPGGQVVHRIPKGFQPMFREQVINAAVDPKYHGSLPQIMELFAESLDKPTHYLARNPTTGSVHHLPSHVFPDYAETVAAGRDSANAAIKNDPGKRAAAAASVLDPQRVNIPEAMDIERWNEEIKKRIEALVAAARGGQ